MSETTCEEFRALSAELALGVADAQDRAAASRHLEHCASCRHELLALSDVADAVSALTPAVEPPAGFESRVLARLDRDEQPVRDAAPRRRTVWVAAVAAVAALAAGTVGWVIGDQVSPTPAVAPGHVVVAQLAADRHSVGQVVVQTTGEPWLSMAVAMGHGDSTVQCQLRATDGRIITLGWFSLSHGYGYWAVPLDAAKGESIAAAQVADANGVVLASAPLPSVRLA